MKILVGNTGLIGKTIREKINFDYEFNSKNIHEYQDVQEYSELYLSCLPATKWMVNKNLQKDLETINQIIEIISKKAYSKVILFSTIDVYNDSPLGVNENYNPNIGRLSYGSNRYIFELLVREYLRSEETIIFRLPALYNKHIKKNVIFDLLNNNEVQNINSNSAYQWYNLDNLHEDIVNYPKQYKTQDLFNLFPEPLETSEILKLFPEYDVPEAKKRIVYDYTTICNEYISSKESCLKNIKRFVDETRSQ
jgi:hypothetical protein